VPAQLEAESPGNPGRFIARPSDFASDMRASGATIRRSAPRY